MSEFHLVLKAGGIFHQEEPGFFDNCGKENVKLSFNGLDELLELELCGPGAFSLYAGGLGGNGSNGWVVGDKWSFESVKSMAVHCQVVSWHVDEPRKVVLASWDIDGLEEVCKEFTNCFEIIIGVCFNNCWEFSSSISDENFCILGHSHSDDG